MIADAGGGGGGPGNKIETLRSHRWSITRLGTIIQDAIVAKELSLPDLKIDRKEILGGLMWYKYAASVKWDDVSVTFYDNGSILSAINQWKDKVYTNETGIKNHSPNQGYKMECEFQLVNGVGGVINKFILHNAWPASITFGKLSYTDTSLKVVTLSLAYDWAEGDVVGSFGKEN